MSKENNLVIQSGLKKGDFRRLAYWNMFGKNKNVLWLLVALFVIGVVGILFVGKMFLLQILSIIFIACPVLVIIAMEFNIFKVARGGALEQRANATYIIGEKGISAQGEREKQPTFYLWNNLHKIYENKQFYIIFIDGVRMLTIAKTDLTSAQEQSLRNILAQYMKADKLNLL